MQHPKWLALIALALPLTLPAKDLQTKEQPFLQAYSGKSRQFVEEQLGKPVKKETAVKPHNADQILQAQQQAIPGAGEQIEMWYYRGKIQYAPNKFFNTAELTFANDKCVNITFANKK
ncbi:hypothetical protein SAMN05192566_0260 [Methylophilus rhizosphaerae]|uniref:SmpA / OmlA family protein n=1 Tax=Methylophilus rhizosphaerae TaxID=492660 RepID=A0A1G8ZFQ8_9PROT|nr:hypothetical protein [Methylophilus rhizosphaerae]SDK13454.1 hypothetical protein SAMN05192566_0260 [Methylophilus rhizosphaerae]